jgi:hypothetical protein
VIVANVVVGAIVHPIAAGAVVVQRFVIVAVVVVFGLAVFDFG